MRVVRFIISLSALSIILVAVKLITGIITVSAVMGVYLPKNRYIDHRYNNDEEYAYDSLKIGMYYGV